MSDQNQDSKNLIRAKAVVSRMSVEEVLALREWLKQHTAQLAQRLSAR